MNSPLRNLLLMVVPAGLVLVAVWAPWNPPSMPDRSPSGQGTTDELLRGLLEAHERSLAVLTRIEERLVMEPVTAGSGPGPASPMPPSFEEWTAGLEALRTSLEATAIGLQEAALTVNGEEPSLREIGTRHTDPDWDVLGELETTWREDPGRADRSQYFLTPRDLLARYGPPTSIYRPSGSLLFVYRRVPEGSPGTAWYFRVQDGIVVEFFVEDESGED